MLDQGYMLERLTEAEIGTAKQLCDEFVGTGLYSADYLKAITADDRHLFYLVRKAGAAIGYFYAQLLLARDLDGLPGLYYEIAASLCRPDQEIGVCRSIGIGTEYRGSGLSDVLLLLFKDCFETDRQVPLILVPAWSKNGVVPAAKLLSRCGFHYLCKLTTPWIDHPSLQCSACGQIPCRCDAVVYYAGGTS